MARTFTYPYLRAALAAVLTTGLSAGVSGAPEPAAALFALKAGNVRFANTEGEAPSGATPRMSIKGGSPLAAVLSCAEARVPAERVFDVAPGDLFVVHAAGAVADRSALASLEYAAQHLRVPLLVVMGHASCDIVRSAARERAEGRGPNFDYVAAAIRPAVERAAAKGDADPARAAVLASVEQVVNDTLKQSAALRRLVQDGSLQIVGAYYEPSSGHVTFSAPVGAASLGTTQHVAGGMQ